MVAISQKKKLNKYVVYPIYEISSDIT